MKQEQVLQIGKYVLYPFSKGKIWIDAGDGEGGSFSESELEKIIDTFYSENF